jgi:hypothetical protein
MGAGGGGSVREAAEAVVVVAVVVVVVVVSLGFPLPNKIAVVAAPTAAEAPATTARVNFDIAGGGGGIQSTIRTAADSEFLCLLSLIVA